jgi:glycerol-3-phosphate dehydrogenase
MKEIVKTDVAIVGGGVAGLWLLNRLRHLGYSAILLESESLGGGQTNKSQGIIHGGMKYALQGSLTAATESAVEMPSIWKECLAGTGEINLSQVPILSSQQFLWSTNTLGGKLSGFFANLTLKSQVISLKKADFPDIFQHPDFSGQVYALDEIVIDVPALVRQLAKPYQDVIFKIAAIQPEQFLFNDSGALEEIQINVSPFTPVSVQAKKFVFTAGAGNELLAQPFKSVAMQRRPLHMVVMKTKFLYPLYAHCLGLSATPRITVTTHQSHDDQTIWYLGGQLAEEGVVRDQATQIKVAKQELTTLFPWIDFASAQFASFFIDRAEGLQPKGKRPDSCIVKEEKNVMVAWPTKLIFAPRVAQEVINSLTQAGIEKSIGDLHALRGWPMPVIAKPIWDELL